MKKIITVFLSCFLLVSLVFSQFAQKYNWKAVNTGGTGYVPGFCLSKTEQNVIYARTDVGGAYRWDETNKSWTRISDWVTETEWPLEGIQAMCTDPKKPGRVYMMGGLYINPPSCIMRSDDYGKTFKRFVTPFQISGVASPSGERLCIDPNNTAVLYCGTYKNGLWKSADNGETWTEMSAFRTAVTVTTGEVLRVSFVVVDPSTGTNGTTSPRIIAGLTRMGNNNLYISNDAGASWAPITGLPTTSAPQRAELSPNGYLYSTFSNIESPGYGNSGGFFKINLSTKAAADITPQAIRTNGYCGIAIDQTNPNHMIITNSSGVLWKATTSGYGERIWRTKDGGVNWVDLASSSQVVMDYQGYNYAVGVNPHWITNIGLDPFNSNRFFFNTGYGVYRCDNLGDLDLGKTITFKFSSTGLNESVVFDIVAPKSGAQLIHSIGDYSGFRHLNVDLPGDRFTPAGGANNYSLDVAELNPNVVVRTTSNPANGAMYSADNGVSWKTLSSYAVADSVYAGKIAASALGNYFVWSPLNKTPRVSDGSSWYLCSGIPNNLRPVSDKVFDGKFYATNGTSLYYSEDGGMTYKSFALTTYGIPSGNGSYGNIRTFPTHEGELWLPLYERGLYYTKWANGVPQFIKIPNVTYCKTVGFGAPKPGSGQVASIFIYGTVSSSSFNGVFRSDDSGASWIQVTDNEHLFAGIGDKGLLVGDPKIYGRVYMTTGGGLGVIYGDTNAAIYDATKETPDSILQVGASRKFTSIQAAYNSLPATLSSSTLIELEADYAPETESYPINFTQKSNSSNTNYVVIRPATGVQKKLESAGTVISFNAADYVRIDGRPDGSGTGTGITLSSTNTASGAKTIEFVNDAQYNVVRFCNVLGSGKSTTSGTIVVGTTTGTSARGGSAGTYTGSGNLYNTIDHCYIGNGTAGLPYNAVYLKGTPTYTNEGTVISNNNIYNFFTDVTDAKTCGVLNELDSHTTQISGNHFYQTDTRTTTGGSLIYPVYINSAGIISSVDNNFIGGVNETGTGIMTIQSTGTARFAGIFVNAVKGGTSISMSGNKISGIDFTSYSPGNSTEGVMAGIVFKAGNLGGAVATNPNEVSQLTLRFGVSISGSNGLCGFSYNFGAGSSNSAYLKVNNLSAIPVGASATIISAKVIGLYSGNSYGGSAKCVEVHDLLCGTSGSIAAHQLYGIWVSTGSNTANTIERNMVYNLNAVSSGASVVYGLACGAGSGITTLKNNMVCLGNDMTSGASIRAIYKNSIGADVFIHNSVYVGGTATGTTQNTYAFMRDVATENTLTGNSVRNNIFVNKRSGGTSGKHYVLSTNLSTDFSSGSYPISCNYNCYDFGTGANNVFGAAAGADYDFVTWKTTTKWDAGSINANPMFADASNASKPNLSIQLNSKIVDQKGDATLTAADDYFGSVRSGLTPCDIGAFAYVYDASAGLNIVQSNPLAVFGGQSSILIPGFAGKSVQIYAMDGQLIKSQQLQSDRETIPVSSGFYIVRIENRVVKIVVR